MKTKIILIGLVALLIGCIPVNMHKPYFKVVSIELVPNKKNISKYELTGDDVADVTWVTIEDATGKYQVGDSLMFVIKTQPDTTINQ